MRVGKILAMQILFPTGLAGNLRRSSEKQYPECDCDCCSTAPRTPDEVSDISAAWKCTKKPECDMSCSDPWGQTLTASAADEMDVERFCSIQCRPFEAALGGPCVALEFKDSASVMTADGNSVDGNFPPEVPTIVGAPPEPAGPAGAAPTLEPPCEYMRPCVYEAMKEHEQAVREGYAVVKDAAADVRALQ